MFVYLAGAQEDRSLSNPIGGKCERATTATTTAAAAWEGKGKSDR